MLTCWMINGSVLNICHSWKRIGKREHLVQEWDVLSFVMLVLWAVTLFWSTDKSTWHYRPEEQHQYLHHRGKLKSHAFFFLQISHLGRYQEHKSNQPTAPQFLTCSEDGSVYVWDLNTQWNKKPPKKKPKRRPYKFMASRTDGLPSKQVTVFRPHYKVLCYHRHK
jgi:WD40 repeat protein